MEEKLLIGADRFFALRWADYALDLWLSEGETLEKYQHLRWWLETQIKGQEAARKTANQLKRLWLEEHDFSALRHQVKADRLHEDHLQRPFLHYGMAYNVFPLFRDVCNIIGFSTQLSGEVSRNMLHQRIREKYGNPESVLRATDRMVQTLTDWGLISVNEKRFSLPPRRISSPSVVNWLALALVYGQTGRKVALRDFTNLPGLLGIEIGDIREVIRTSKSLTIERDGSFDEIILPKM